MRKAALLYNPESGGSRLRQRELESALAILRAGGVEAEVFPTHSREHAGEQAKQAIADGCDTIFACGGDGTIHNMIQVLANTPVALGIFPMGTANALAHDLRIPMRVPDAAKAALTGTIRRVALGHIRCKGMDGAPITRFFVVAAGMGVDAHLFYKLQSGVKQRLGMTAYYAKAWHMWFSYPMTRFCVEYTEDVGADPKKVDLTELLAVRIRYFGGLLQELAPGAALDRNDMRLILCKTASRVAYLAYVTRNLFGRLWSVRGIELAYGIKATCDYLDSANAPTRTYVEADGELIGSLPAELTIVTDALTLLAPAG